MSDGAHIEWTDATWNVVNGCSVVSPGCTNCYAMRLAGTRMRHHPSRQGLTAPSKAGPVWTGGVRFNDKVLLDPLKWRRPRKIFVCAHGDLFHDAVPDVWIDRVFAVMALAPQHVFQLLTKRPERMRDYLADHASDDIERNLGTRWSRQVCAIGYKERALQGAPRFPLPNVWLGVSVEDQQRADERIPILLDTPAAVRWLSCEPLLGPLELRWVAFDGVTELNVLTGEHIFSDVPPGRRIDWVVAGGESGPGARGFTDEVEGWMRSLRNQCASAKVPFYGKQNYRKLPLPDDLLVREYPDAR